LKGSLDIPGTVALLNAMKLAAMAAPRTVVCDLTELRDPLQPHLLTVFAAAQRRLGPWPERDLQVSAASPTIERRLVRLGIDRYITLQPTITKALAMARVTSTARRCTLPFTPELTSPGRARRSLATFLGEGLDRWDAMIQLVVGELTANAVRHVHQPFTLHLELGTSQLLVGVTDASRQEPILRPPRAQAGSGRGIQLIDAVSQTWGVRLIHDAGKTVWARMAPSIA
jgi:anti-sigma regulatory factor (Ser/Thr protein kinase)